MDWGLIGPGIAEPGFRGLPRLVDMMLRSEVGVGSQKPRRAERPNVSTEASNAEHCHERNATLE